MSYSRILVPVDGSAPSECGLREAIRIALPMHARLFVLNVVNEFPLMMDPVSTAGYGSLLDALRRNGEEIAAKATKAVKEAGLDCESAVLEASTGSVADIIVEQVAGRDCDLVVMGTHGRRGMKRLALGSDAELVVRHSPVPVLLVKPAATSG